MMSGSLKNGGKHRTLINIIDDFNWEWIAIEVAATSLSDIRAICVPEQLNELRASPKNIAIDNSPLFICRAMLICSERSSVCLHCIGIGWSSQNVFFELFNCKFRNEDFNIDQN